ncbi:Targeting protein for Xklp2 [Folsomia candida]|uniref:Targeting protein for Xklp2 n=1 Tax=Folsomia candida TaxID=158441 RepID=A0A226DNG9_FOLCA|nr:Targeting protein for Xklp2 [Folsomia candida]
MAHQDKPTTTVQRNGGSNGRGYSGSGGTVVAYQDLESLDVDHYDFINAPQYVDFADLAHNDDPNADLFFETHREEDDFLISIDNISPTVQFLHEQQQQQNNMLTSITQEVNEAAAKVGMNDIQVVYYSSPASAPRGSSDQKMRKIGGGSLNSSNGSSYYTPMGLDDGKFEYDKENCAPPQSLNTPELGKESGKEPVKKLSYSAAFSDGIEDKDKTIVNQDEEGNRNIVKSQSPSKDFLLAQIEKLQLLSSDEDEAVEQESSLEKSYESPTKSMVTDDALVNSLLKTPGAARIISNSIKPRPITNERKPFFALPPHKPNLFEGLFIVSPSPSKPNTLQQNRENLDSSTITKENHDEQRFHKHEFPVFQGPVGNDDRKMSMLVENSIGQEVVWNNETELPDATAFISQELITGNAAQREFVTDSCDVNEEEEEENETLTRSFEGPHLRSGLAFIPSTGFGPDKGRRVSSLSDLTSIQGFKNKFNNTKPGLKSVTKFAAAGGKLTIPQSPDASKRLPSKCRSDFKASAQSSSTSSMAFSKRTEASKKYVPPAPIPYRSTSRGPLKATTKYMSLAEEVAKFQKSTPDRFRSLPRVKIPMRQQSASCERELVKPLSSNAVDAQELSFLPSTSRSSRASSVCSNRGGVTRAPQRTTIPQPFHFGTTSRPKTSVIDSKQQNVADFKFKARPMPKVQGPVGIHERPPVKVTLPVAPHFASDDRIRERNVKRAQSATQSPTGHVPSQPKPSRIPTTARGAHHGNSSESQTMRTTTFKPFSFDQRDQEMLRRKEEKIKKEIEEERKIPEFHANPLPKFEPLPTKRPVQSTLVEPFRLESDERGRAYQQAMNQKLEEERQRLRVLTTFHANPAVVLQQPAFEPEYPVRPPLAPLDLHLYTEKRAAEREQFEHSLRQKELEEEQRRQEEQVRLKEQHRLDEIERRRQIVHKAQPFKVPKPFELKPSNRPLTIPQSPAFNPLPSQRRTTPTKNTSM